MNIRELAIEDGKYRVDVQAYGETTWATNALRFASVEDATLYAFDLYSRWTMSKAMRVVTSDTPDREPVDLTDPRVVIGREEVPA